MDDRDIRRNPLVWIEAFLLLAAVACAGCWFAIKTVHESDDSRLLVAVSRQRILSQRVGLLAHEYVGAEDAYVRLDLRWELRTIADELKLITARHMQIHRVSGTTQAHPATADESPLTDRPLSPAVMDIYGRAPTMLKYHVDEFAATVKQLASQSATDITQEPALADLVEERSEQLLPKLEMLANQLQQEHDAAVAWQVSLQVRNLAAMLVALVVAGLLLAWPSLRRARADQRASADDSSLQRASNQPAASTPLSAPRTTTGPKTA